MNLNKNTPNIISLFRIILVPIIFILIILSFKIHIKFISFKIGSNINYGIDILSFISGILFLIASLSDFLDGYIARKYNLVSDSGKLLDAIADKILVNAVLIAFLYINIIPVYIVFLLIIRDFCIDALRLFLATKNNIVLPASKLGKFKTIFIMSGLVLLFILNRNLIYKDDLKIEMYSLINQILLIPIYIGTILSLISSISYFFSSMKQIKKTQDKK